MPLSGWRRRLSSIISTVHMMRHGADIQKNYIFSNDPINTTNQVWGIVVRDGTILRLSLNENQIYGVSSLNAALMGSISGQRLGKSVLHTIRNLTQFGSNKILIVFPK